MCAGLLWVLAWMGADTAAASDVVATGILQHKTDEAFATISDLANYALLIPGDCAVDWVHDVQTAGLGGSAVVEYRAGPMRRRLEAKITRVQPNKRLDITHPGKRGFVTTWRFTDVAGVTEVELRTWLTAPPKPFRRAFITRVHPAWTSCHQRTVDNLIQTIQPG